MGLAPGWPLHLLARRWARLGTILQVGALLLIAGLSFDRLQTGLPYQNMTGRSEDFERGTAGMEQGEPGALLLSDWESITPLWYAQRVNGLNPRIRTALVTAPPGSDTWLVQAEQEIDRRTISLPERLPALRDKYRLFPVGSLFDLAPRAVTERSEAGLLTNDRSVRLLRLPPGSALGRARRAGSAYAVPADGRAARHAALAHAAAGERAAGRDTARGRAPLSFRHLGNRRGDRRDLPV
jgi:hypothetical protein